MYKPITKHLARHLTVPGFLAFCAGLIMIWPVLVTAMPPVLDYPNHVVRFWLLSGGANLSPLSTWFKVDWSHTATNMGMDVLAVGLNTVFSAPITGRIILGLSAVLPVAGSVLVSRQLFGKWSYWHILLGLNAWGLLLLTGLMSFQLSLGAALICLWLDMRLAGQPRLWRWLRQVLQGVIIILIHPFGAAFYLVLITGLALGPDAASLKRPTEWPGRLKGLADVWLPLGLAGLLISVRIMLSGQTSEGGGLQFFWDPDAFTPAHAMRALFAPSRTYNLPVDLVFIAFLWLPVVISDIQRRLKRHGGLLVTGSALFVFSLACPQGIGSTSLVDVRLAAMALLILPMALDPEITLKHHTPIILCALALSVLGLRSAWMANIWVERQADVRALYRAMDYIPVGARVVPLTVTVDDEDTEPQKRYLGRYLGGITNTFAHLDSLAVMRRHAYVPTIFAEPGKQPLSVRDPYIDHHEISGGIMGTRADLQPQKLVIAGYLPYWRTEFDYILILNADMNPADSQLSDGACLVTDEGFAKLYRIQATPCQP